MASIRQLIFILLFYSLAAPAAQQPDSLAANHLILIKPQSTTDRNFSGDLQYANAGSQLSRPLRVQVLSGRDLSAAAGVPVYFQLLSAPGKAESFALGDSVVYSDEHGFAATRCTLGDLSGEYQIAARIQNASHRDDLLVFRVFARESSWAIFLLMGVAGGLGMFLYGMSLMSHGMKKTAGHRMRAILSRLTDNRFVALGVGAFVTMIIQSSSATTVMLVSFVQAQLMTFAQSLGIIAGANIGTTITAQLVAFKLTDYALMMVAIGIALMLVGKRQEFKTAGETVLGFGLLFFGMHIMSESMYPLRSYDPFLELLVRLENPVLGILVGALFTALIQSSSAFTGIVIVLAVQGLLTLEAGIPLIFGANIGTCITAGLAAMNTSRDAKRVALAHTLFQIVGVVLFIGWISGFAEIVRWISPKGSSAGTGSTSLAEIVPRQIANAHTIFNIVTALVFLPFFGVVSKFILRLLPDRPARETETFKTKYLDRTMLNTPALALSLARAEIVSMGEVAQDMTRKIIEPFVSKRRDVIEELEVSEEQVDFLEGEINDFLTRITQQSVPQSEVDEAFLMMYAVIEFEHIADIIIKNLLPRARRWAGTDLRFSPSGQKEIIEYHQLTVDQIGQALLAFKTFDLQKARSIKQKYKEYRSLEEEFMRTHFQRLRQNIPESRATSEFHQDLMEQFRRINSHAASIARIMLDWTPRQS